MLEQSRPPLYPSKQLFRGPQQISDFAIAALTEMAEDYAKKTSTIRLSDVSMETLYELMDTLHLPAKGAVWPNKPKISQHVDGFVWLRGDEDSNENRLAYMEHLKSILQIPTDYDLVDAQPDRKLLSTELFLGMAESRKICGTTDVTIAKAVHVHNHALRNNIEVLLELKTVQDMKNNDHSPQAICEHLAASYLNLDHAIVSVLTDLNSEWIFFWFAFGEVDSKISLHKLRLVGDEAAKYAKYLLDSLHDNSIVNLPVTFAKRQPFQAVLDDCLHRKQILMELFNDCGKPRTKIQSRHRQVTRNRILVQTLVWQMVATV